MQMAFRILRALCVLALAGLVLAGCATITPKDPGVTLGSDWAGPEELANATMFVTPPRVENARGFEISVPQGVAPLVCKNWRDLDGKKVRICRTAVRAFLDGRKASAYPYGGEGWFVFSTDRPGSVVVLSVDGRRVTTPIVREISPEEVRSVYADMGATFNCSSPATGLLYTDPSGRCSATPGKIDVPVLGVPALNDNMERCGVVGPCKVSTNLPEYPVGGIRYLLSSPRRLK